ncbi:MAG: TonB family protein [Terriglobia bacterium]
MIRNHTNGASASAVDAMMALLAVAVCAASALAASRSCAAGVAAPPLEIGGRAASRLLVNQVRPHYPPLARINYIRGHVRLLVTVGCDGRVDSVHVLRGHPFLALAALEAIRRWIYRPFVTPSGPAAFQTHVDVDFSLLGQRGEAARLPPKPEKFLERGIEPPRLRGAPPASGGSDVVSMRLLVNRDGRVVDCTLLSGTQGQFETARKVVSRWRFQPARWGNLSVPWYVDVKVSVPDASSRRPAVALNGR